MAFPSLGLEPTAAGNVIEGAVRNVAAPSFASGDSVAGSVASGLVTGAVRAGTAMVDDLVGGSENRQLIQGAASSVFESAKDVVMGRQSIGDLFSGAGNSSTGIAAGSVGDFSDVNGICMGPVGGGLLTSLGGLGLTLAGREGSDWGYLSRHLIARIYPCDSHGVAIPMELGVSGPATDVNFDTTLNWQSPFENIGPEAKAPALMAMIQSGALVPVINAIQAVLPEDGGVISSSLQRGSDTLKKAVRDLEGKTGITKLNSRQVFSGMPPIKVTLTLHFRALTDSMAEVVNPYQRLLEWAMPQRLSEDGILAGAIDGAGSVDYGKFASRDSASEGAGSAVEKFLKVMFPSDAPMLVGFIYGNNRYPAMVIESISNPLDGPMDENGRPSYRAVQLTLATLTALDRGDIGKMFV